MTGSQSGRNQTGLAELTYDETAGRYLLTMRATGEHARRRPIVVTLSRHEVGHSSGSSPSGGEREQPLGSEQRVSDAGERKSLRMRAPCGPATPSVLCWR